jgi:2-methylcitrate dehydratase PrpD
MPARDLAFDLAEHAACTPLEAIPDDVLGLLSHDLVDSIGVILGGLHAPGVPETRAFISETVRPGAAAVFGTDLRWPAAFAAQANATAGHALDFDDTLDEGGGMHAGVPVHAAALAVAEELGDADGDTYLRAVALGLDVAVRLALAPSHDYGWHRTSAFGVFGATVAAGRLAGLDVEAMRNALGIAYSQASGNRQCIADGALSKRLQSGFAARDAITAVRLAQRGLTGATNIFEGANGFFPLYQRGGYDRELILKDLGRDFLSRRISLKPYPCGRNLHAMVDAAIALRGRTDGRAVAGVEIGLDERALATADRAYPAFVVPAQFSRPFATALALANGRLSIGDFADPHAVSPAVQDLFQRISLVSWPNDGSGTRLVVVYTDGSVDSEEASTASGHPTKPLTLDQVRAKFLDCNEASGLPLDLERSGRVIEAGIAVRALATTRHLTELLSVPERVTA